MSPGETAIGIRLPVLSHNENMSVARFANLRVLVIAPPSPHTTKLTDLLLCTMLAQEVYRCATVEEAETRVPEISFDLCFVADWLGGREKTALITSLSRDAKRTHCPVIAAFANDDTASIVALVRAGAHAIFVPPFEESRLRASISCAFDTLEGLAGAEHSPNEQITSFTWILESVANKIQRIADQLDQDSTGLPADPDLLKQAILAAISASDMPNGDLPVKVIESVKDALYRTRQQNRRTQHSPQS